MCWADTHAAETEEPGSVFSSPPGKMRIKKKNINKGKVSNVNVKENLGNSPVLQNYCVHI